MGTRNLGRALALAGIILSCIWGVIGAALASPAAAGAAFAVSDNTGTIEVVTNLSGATYTISGAAPYSGTGPHTFLGCPLGSYYISWEVMDGYTRQASDLSAELISEGDTIRFTGYFEPTAPQAGTIVVNSSPNGAAFDISGPRDYRGTTPWSTDDAPVGDYTIDWGANATPSSATMQSLSAGGSITFSASYSPPAQPGTIVVTANVPGATFTISGAAPYSGTAPASFPGAPAGPYTIQWGALLGYTAPADQSLTLASGLSISFNGIYTAGPDILGPVISGVAATGVTESAATILWNTDEPADGQVQYGATTNYGLSTPLNATLTTGHSVTLTGLVYGTLYHFRVVSKDAAGNSTTSGDGTFTTVDNMPPAISGVSVTDVTPASATVVWTTNEKSDSQVEYGLGITFGFVTPVNTALVTSHKVTITGLNPGTWYYYRVTSKDLAGNPMQSERFDFLTAKDTPPVISSVIVTDISASGMTVKWDTDGRTDSQVEYGLTANYGSITTVDSTLVLNHSVAVTGLSAQTTYHFRVISTDYWGNSSRSPDATVITTDVDAPIISGVAATAITDTSVIIVWFTDAVSESSVEYGTSTNYGMVSAYDNAMVTSHSVSLSALVAQTTYHYKVKSRDASGLWSQTPDYTFTTGIDMGTDPPKILYLTPGEPTSSGTTISWSTDELATSQIEYGLTDKYGTSTAPSTDFKTVHVVQLTGLKSGMTYHYRVICTDAAGNRSVSEDGTFNTPMGRAPLPSLPVWAWALVGVAGVLVVGVLVVKNR